MNGATQLRHRDEAGLERPERGRVAVPEAPARAPHVPVREVVDERRDRLPGARRVVGLHPVADLLDRRLQARDRPAVELGRRRRRLAHVVRVRVQDVEAVRVPELEQELAHGLADRLGREQVAVPRLLGGQVVPAEGVGAVLVDDVPGHDDVAQRLRHLLALRVGDVAEAEHRPVRRAVEQQRRDRDQRVEPAARLVDRLADVVGRERLARTAPRSRTARGAARTASRPSRTRRRSPRARGASRSPHSAHGQVCSSTYGRCGSGSGGRSAPAPRRTSRRTRRGRSRSARRGAACPSSARARSPSRRCSPATCRSGRA